MDKLNKKITVWLIFISLLSMPWPSTTAYAQNTRQEQGWNACKYWKRTGPLAAGTAFAFAFVPGLQGVGLVYGGYAAFGRIYVGFFCD